MRIRDVAPDIELSGRIAFAVSQGFGIFTFLANNFLAKNGIGKLNGDASLEVSRDDWFPFVSFLKAFFEIQERIGDARMYEIGLQIVRNAVLAPGTVDVFSVLNGLDVTYHLNHRRNGELLYDNIRKVPLPGIGNYFVQELAATRAIVTCDNPCPCSYTRGVITGQVQRLASYARIEHRDDGPCRTRGDPSCTYLVEW